MAFTAPQVYFRRLEGRTFDSAAAEARRCRRIKGTKGIFKGRRRRRGRRRGAHRRRRRSWVRLRVTELADFESASLPGPPPARCGSGASHIFALRRRRLPLLPAPRRPRPPLSHKSEGGREGCRPLGGLGLGRVGGAAASASGRSALSFEAPRFPRHRRRGHAGPRLGRIPRRRAARRAVPRILGCSTWPGEVRRPRSTRAQGSILQGRPPGFCQRRSKERRRRAARGFGADSARPRGA
mmetsp:Transcript_12530/g.43301  ORF Transcript_12530/g.43301 Transcript_12530/m.43301 type:complete len:239 (+) Transcript_12530:536-1252(+)